MEKTQKTKILIFFVLTLAFFVALPAVASAAILYFSPSSGSQVVGATLSVSVYVSSAEQAMNAASGVILFPSDKIEVASLSKTGSIFSLWVQEPSFSNSVGTINFEGIALNPGFIGTGGKLFTINFRVKTAGSAPLSFSSGSVLANDGQGTNILSSLDSASFSLGIAGSVAPEAETPPAVTGTPAAPQISSPTHPDSEKWYSNSTPKFTWTIPSGVTAVRLLVDKIPTAVPTVIYVPAISKKEVASLADGIYYFHAQFRNAGGWGEISHFRFQIDTVPPEPIMINFVDGKVMEQPRVKIIFNTVDTLSGIDYYSVKISGDSLPVISSIDFITHNPYTLPPQSPGIHSLEVVAFDKAGNITTATDEFVIKPAISPLISEFPQQLNSGENLEIKGESVYPKASIVLFIQKDNDEPNIYQIITDKEGKFVYISKESLQTGVYKLWAYVTDEKGTQSNPSEKISINVSGSVIFRIGTWVNNFLTVVVSFVALIFALLFIVWHGWRKFSSFRKKIHKETQEAGEALRQAFSALKEETKERIAELDGKPDLNKREKKVCDNLKKALKISEKFIGKEIEDIEKAVK